MRKCCSTAVCLCACGRKPAGAVRKALQEHGGAQRYDSSLRKGENDGKMQILCFAGYEALLRMQ